MSRAFDHICMEKARYKFLIIIIIIIIIIVLVNPWKNRASSEFSKNL